MHKPAIVVVTYNREMSLVRLLSSISSANINSSSVDLVISIDGGADNNENIYEIASGYRWAAGNKQIIRHDHYLGLRNHILSCGDLTAEYGSIILLEDDLYVHPDFYSYATGALAFYEKDDHISQVALYSYNLNTNVVLPFVPLKNNFDTYFMKFPCSWGQCWTNKQWKGFRRWYDDGQEILPEDSLPYAVKLWPETSWLKYFAKYNEENDKYVVYPYSALTTNYNDEGIHNKSGHYIYQSFLSYHIGSYKLAHFREGLKYDTFFELDPEIVKDSIEELREFDFELDLFGSKVGVSCKSKYLISSGLCKNPIMQFSDILKPYEQNILLNNKSENGAFCLGLKDSFVATPSHSLRWARSTVPLPFRDKLRLIISDILKKIRSI